MRTGCGAWKLRRCRGPGFTLPEVVVSLAVAGIMFAGVIYGYVFLTEQADWSAYSLTAHSLAMQGVEQARSTEWDSRAWSPVDELAI